MFGFGGTKPTLPQHDSDGEARTQQLAEAREAYRYSYDALGGLPLGAEVPPGEKFSIEYIAKLAGVLAAQFANKSAIELTEESYKENISTVERVASLLHGAREGDVAKVLRDFDAELQAGVGSRRASEHREFMHLFKTIKVPEFAHNWWEDRIFAWQRIAGANPGLIERVYELDDRFPVTEEIFAKATQGTVTLDQALEEGRIFLTDYALLHDLPTNDFRGAPKFVFAPLALFYLKKPPPGATAQLQPVAIQCAQQPGPANPIFTPRDGVCWTMAKTTVQVAEGHHHEMIAHLGETHLIIERFIVATHRQLAERHPIKVLLEHHFSFTMEINSIAKNRLLAVGGPIDMSIAGGALGCTEITKRSLETYQFDTAGLPARLESRGVGENEILSDYPYRDDGMPVWDAVHRFVDAYVRLYYTADTDVVEDAELRAWVEEVTSPEGGRLPGMAAIDGVDRLVDVVAQLIFTCSAGHAAVNFAQFPCFGYIPNVPGAAYAPGPGPDTSPDDESAYLAMLPPMEAALIQSDTVYGLSAMNFLRLGEYPRHQFEDRRVKKLLKRFQAELADIDDATTIRNKARPADYGYLRPSVIPASINI